MEEGTTSVQLHSGKQVKERCGLICPKQAETEASKLGATKEHPTSHQRTSKDSGTDSTTMEVGTQERLKTGGLDFPGGTVVRNLPANAGDTGLIPGLGRSHMLRNN